jgi:hypothetical protein
VRGCVKVSGGPAPSQERKPSAGSQCGRVRRRGARPFLSSQSAVAMSASSARYWEVIVDPLGTYTLGDCGTAAVWV